MKDSSVNWNTRLHCQVSFIKYEVKNHSDSWTTYCSWFTSHHQTVDTTWPSGLTLTLKPWTLRWRSTFRHFSSLQINNFLKCPTLQQCVGVFFCFTSWKIWPNLLFYFFSSASSRPLYGSKKGRTVSWSFPAVALQRRLREVRGVLLWRLQRESQQLLEHGWVHQGLLRLRYQ